MLGKSLGNEQHLHVYISHTRLRHRTIKLIPDNWLCSKVPDIFKVCSDTRQGQACVFWTSVLLHPSRPGKVWLTCSSSVCPVLVFSSNPKEVSFFHRKSLQIFENSFYNCPLSFLPLAKHIQFLQPLEMRGSKWSLLYSRWKPTKSEKG